MKPAVPYVPYATSSKEKTGDIITFAQFEEGCLQSESCNGTEIGDEYDDSDDDLTLTPLISESEMDEMSSGNKSYAEPMPTYMLEDIRDGSQSCSSINRREAR